MSKKKKSLKKKIKKKIVAPFSAVNKKMFKIAETKVSSLLESNLIIPLTSVIMNSIKDATYVSMTVDGYYDSYINKAITVVLKDFIDPFYDNYLTDVDKTLAICENSIDEIRSSVTYYPELVNKTIAPGYYVVKLDHKTTLIINKQGSNDYNSKGRKNKGDSSTYTTNIFIVGGNRVKWMTELQSKIDTIVTKMIAPNQGNNKLKVKTLSGLDEEVVTDIKTRPMKFIISPFKENILNNIRLFKSKEGLYKELGIPHSLGLLLYGPPGTGKTVMAHAIATEFNMSCIDVTLDYFDKKSGSGAFSEANTVYVIDEIDSQLVNRALTTAEANTEATKMITSQRLIKLLKSIDEMDNGSIVVATTNYPERLDKALTRSGRFTLKYEFPTFTREYAEKMCNSRGLSLDDVLRKSDKEVDPNHIVPADLEQLIIDKLIEENCIVEQKSSFEDLGIENSDEILKEIEDNEHSEFADAVKGSIDDDDDDEEY